MKVILFLFALWTSGTQGAKILGVFPAPAPSHYNLGSALLRGLAERGHDVTMISPFSEKNPPKKGSYRDIVLTGFSEARNEKRKEINMYDMEDFNVFLMMPFIAHMMLNMTEETLKHPNFQKLLRSDEQFDVVIVEQFMNEALKALANHYKAPQIVLSTVGANAWVNLLVGNPSPPSYIPDILLSYSSNMTFYQRLMNSITYVCSKAMHHLYMFPKQNQLIQKYFPNPPQIDDVIYNASLVLLNSHPSINQPVPFVPNMIDIGGYHVQPPKKLPQDLQEFLDGAKDGVIYFSMGSNLRSADLPDAKRQVFLNTFSKLKQKVLWKWEADALPGQPQNVKLGKWLPQQDILAHPNVKLFITHGGLLSTIETIYHGVPVLAIPIAGDQKLNAQRTVNEGFGLMLRYKEISEETLTGKLDELLTNPKYAQNAKTRSVLFHDRIVGPMDTAGYWVEYVIRHGGAPHLRVAALDLPWYKYLLLDVIAFVAVASFVGSGIFYLVVKTLISFCCKQRKQKLKKN